MRCFPFFGSGPECDKVFYILSQYAVIVNKKYFPKIFKKGRGGKLFLKSFPPPLSALF
jgi:hypothetical protein